MICVDNSEFTRNGDFAPTRFQAQTDAVNLLAGAKTGANPEATVGVMSLAGRSPRVLVTLTTDLGKVLTAMTEIPIEGQANLAQGIQIAQLALKHRQNKVQRQRIVLFVGSPVQESKASTRDRVGLAGADRTRRRPLRLSYAGGADPAGQEAEEEQRGDRRRGLFGGGLERRQAGRHGRGSQQQR